MISISVLEAKKLGSPEPCRSAPIHASYAAKLGGSYWQSVTTRAHDHRIARGSAYEVAAALDVGLGFGAVSPAHHQHGKELCDHLAAMLTKFRNPIRR